MNLSRREMVFVPGTYEQTISTGTRVASLVNVTEIEIVSSSFRLAVALLYIFLRMEGAIMDVMWRMKGQYIKNCNCIATCPCDTIGFPYPLKGCQGMAGMHIVEGNYGNVKLDGLSWVVTYSWPGALHEGNGTVQPFVDNKATEEQRNALLTIMSGQGGNAWFEVLASIVTTVLDPQFLPITWEFDKTGRKARVSIPGFLETVSSPLKVPATNDEQMVIVRMPNGMEYKEFYVAQSSVLKGTGPMKFDYKNTHSSLADVEHTNKGLQA